MLARMRATNQQWCALVLTLVAGCPTTNSPDDAASTDAYVPELVPGVPNDSQTCELTRAQLSARCEALLPEGLGPERPIRCLDGTTFPAFASATQCVDAGWDSCESSPACTPPSIAVVRCTRAIVAACVGGGAADIEERDTWCAVRAPTECTVDRSLA